MPKVDDIGFSKITPLKMEILGKIFSMHIKVTNAVIARYPYYKKAYRYIDLTAGKGIVPDINIKGSPLVFLEEVTNINNNYHFAIDLIESNPNNYRELENNVKCTPLLNIVINPHKGKYQDIIPSLLRDIDKNELGLIFVDPSGNPPDFKIMKYISEVRPHMELLMYLSSTNIKRLPQKKSLEDFMREISKKFWLVRRPFRFDKFGWTFLLGSNTDIFKTYKSIDFYQFDSDEARSFFPLLNLSKTQRKEKLQPKLPFI